MNFVNLTGVLLMLFAWPSSSTLARAAARNSLAPQRPEIFDIKTEPSPHDWKRFHALNALERENLWSYHAKKRNKLGDWAWGWRLAWVRACIGYDAGYCQQVVKDGLRDRAMVVRAETVSRLGEKYAGSGSPGLLTDLEKVYNDPRNSRNGKPLFIKQRILYAIQQVGGERAKTIATRLAGKHQSTQNYWQKIRKI